MGGVIDNIAGLWGESAADKSVDQRNNELTQQTQLWERQFGPVNDSLRSEMMRVLGADTSPSPKNKWLDDFKGEMRTEIESGIRPAEESAKAALLDRVRANPRGMSSQSYARGLKDIVAEGAKARGTAFRTGMTQAELTPMNLALSFMGRTPYTPKADTVYPPNYPVDTAGIKMMGSGLDSILKSGYEGMFGPRETSSSSSGFEDWGQGGGSDVMSQADFEALWS